MVLPIVMVVVGDELYSDYKMRGGYLSCELLPTNKHCVSGERRCESESRKLADSGVSAIQHKYGELGSH